MPPGTAILSRESTAFFMCPMQEYDRDRIAYFPDLINVANNMLKSAKLMGIPVLAIEHASFGATIPELDKSCIMKIFEKETFSMLGCPELEKAFEGLTGIKAVVIFGVMADVCVFNTALELLERGYDVHVVADGVSSDYNCERMLTFDHLRQSGAFVHTSKAIVYNLAKKTTDPIFKKLMALVHDTPMDQGLINALGK